MLYSIAYSLNKKTSTIEFFKIHSSIKLNYAIVNIKDVNLIASSTKILDFTNTEFNGDIYNFLKGSENLCKVLTKENFGFYISAILLTDTIKKNNKNVFDAAKILTNLSYITGNSFLKDIFHHYDPKDVLPIPSLAFHVTSCGNLEFYLVYNTSPLTEPFIELVSVDIPSPNTYVRGYFRIFTSASFGGRLRKEDLKDAIRSTLIFDEPLDDHILNLKDSDFALYLSTLLDYLKKQESVVDLDNMISDKLQTSSSNTIVLAANKIINTNKLYLDEFKMSNTYKSINVTL